MKSTTVLGVSIAALVIVIVAVLLYKGKSPGVKQLETNDKGIAEINARNANGITIGNTTFTAAQLGHQPTVKEQIAAQQKLGYSLEKIAANLNTSVADLQTYIKTM